MSERACMDRSYACACECGLHALATSVYMYYVCACVIYAYMYEKIIRIWPEKKVGICTGKMYVYENTYHHHHHHQIPSATKRCADPTQLISRQCIFYISLEIQAATETLHERKQMQQRMVATAELSPVRRA
jgi:hypothetical protein